MGLSKLFGPDKVSSLIKGFKIGSIGSKVVFWQIDQNMRIRTGKIMDYDTQTLKRQGHITWAHSYYKLNGFNPSQCIYGLHLLKEASYDAPICIAEAEKTAIVMAGYYPDLIWMATGGIHGLKADKLLPLKGHSIYLFPDIGCEVKWAEKQQDLEI